MKKFFCILMLLTVLVSTASSTEVILTFTGDVTLGNEERMLGRTDSFTNFWQEYGSSYFLSEFAGYFAEDDLTIINLEGALTNSAKQENKEKAHRFRGATDMVEILTSSSVEAANISNNHSHDFGSQGFTSTIDTLETAKIGYFGEKYTYIFQKDNVRIAFLGAEKREYIAEMKWFRQEIARLKAEENVSAVVMVFHCGAEYDKHRDNSQMRYAKAVIDAGADLVIMHHPHVAQGVEIYGNRTICYSLGNFCFGGNNVVKAMEAVLARVTMEFDDDGKYIGQQVNLVPVAISGTYPASNYQPRFATKEQASNVIAVIQNDTDFPLPEYDSEKQAVCLPYLPAENKQ